MHDPIAAAEQGVLGALLLDSRARCRLDGLDAAHFASAEHREIYAAILDEIDDSGTADVVMVYERLSRNGAAVRVGGLTYLNALAANTPSAANIGAYARRVRDAALRRQAEELLTSAGEALQRDDVDTAERLAARVIEIVRDRARSMRGLDLRALAQREPEPPAFVIRDLLPAGEVTLLAGHGGSGKSTVALICAICIAAGVAFFGIPCERRRVLFVSFEDGESVLHWRLRRACDMLGVDPADLDGWLVLVDATASEPLFVESREGYGATPAYDSLRAQMRRAQVLILDNVSDAFAANENARPQVRAFVRAIRSLLPADGAALLIAHVDKAAAKAPGDALGFSGSTAWHNSARARWYLRPDDSDDRRLLLEVRKSNHGPVGAQVAIRWSDAAHTFIADGQMPVSRLARAMSELDERAAVLDLIRKAEAAGDPIPTAIRGGRTAHAVAEARGLPTALCGKRGRTRFYAHIEALRAAGAVRVDSILRPNRHYAEVYRAAAPATERAPATEQTSQATERYAPATEH